MSQYYLMAQLPSLDVVGETTPLPITEERFTELCSRFLSKKSLATLQKLTLSPPRTEEKTGNGLVDAWNQGERQLRMLLGSARAGKMKKTFEGSEDAFTVQMKQAVRTAVDMEDPLEAERFLNRYRCGMLEELRPRDAFSEDAVFYYGLKLKLILRMQQFDEALGRTRYQNIYDSILRGEEQEVTQ